LLTLYLGFLLILRVPSAICHGVDAIMSNNPNDARINVQIQHWLARLKSAGVDHQLPLNPLPYDAVVSSKFGVRNINKSAPGATHNHEAIDTVPADGKRDNVDVLAVVSGTVLFAGKYNEASGFSVMIGGDNGKIYSYAHLKEGSFKVGVGEAVVRAQPIAIMGNTGNVSTYIDTKGNKVKMPCVHVVERQIHLRFDAHQPPDFDKWAWQQHVRSGQKGASGAAFAYAIKSFLVEHSADTLTLDDFNKVPARFGWQENPAKGDIIPKNTSAQIHYDPTEVHRSASRTDAGIKSAQQESTMSRLLRGFACTFTAVHAESICEPPPRSRYSVTIPLDPPKTRGH
jgi:hypothetical protein